MDKERVCRASVSVERSPTDSFHATTLKREVIEEEEEEEEKEEGAKRSFRKKSGRGTFGAKNTLTRFFM